MGYNDGQANGKRTAASSDIDIHITDYGYMTLSNEHREELDKAADVISNILSNAKEELRSKSALYRNLMKILNTPISDLLD